MTTWQPDPAVPDADSVRREHNRFPALDGMRAIAVLCVVGTHAAFWTGHYVHGAGTSALMHLDIGVAIFFVISGFLLSREWLVAAARNTPAISMRAYLWRRAVRILPMYWITVVAAFVIRPEHSHPTGADWLRHFALIQVYRPNWLRPALTQTWSLCTEAAFYLVLPILALIVVALSRRGVSIGLAAAGLGSVLLLGSLGWTIWFHSTDHALYNTVQFWLPTTIGWFGVGIAMAGIHVQLSESSATRHWRWAASLGASPGICWVIGMCLYLLIVTPIAGPGSGGDATTAQLIARTTFYAATAGILVWPAVFGQTRGIRAVLGSRPMRYLGDISYSIFLIHLLVLYGAMRLLGYRLFTGSTLSLFITGTLITVLFASLSYRYVELPAQRLRRLVAPHRRRRQTESLSV